MLCSLPTVHHRMYSYLEYITNGIKNEFSVKSPFDRFCVFKGAQSPCNCEIFECSNFHDFYTIKLSYILIFLGGYAPFHFLSHTENTHKFLMRILSERLQVPDAYAQCTHEFLMRMLSARMSS